MKMDMFDIDERIKLLEKVKAKAGEKVDLQDSLNVRLQNGCYRYYNGNGKYLRQDQTDEIRKLEEKLYYNKLINAAEKEKHILQRIQKLWKKKPAFENVYLQLPKEKRHLIEPFQVEVFNDSDIKNLSRLNLFESQKFYDSDKVYLTKNGEKVRSKSEVIIADRLFYQGIPYHYENPLFLNNYKVWHPDFVILNTRTGQQYWWEHFGLMDDPEYCDSCQRKLEIFAENGIFYGKNLIITMESSLHNLNTLFVDLLIKEFLL